VKLPDEPLPRRPYRNSAIFYAVLAGAVIAFGLLTGNGPAETIVIAVVFFVLATGYTWWRFRQRIEREGAGR
jgi:membrane protein implicated in regulation of membrane protease activity